MCDLCVVSVGCVWRLCVGYRGCRWGVRHVLSLCVWCVCVGYIRGVQCVCSLCRLWGLKDVAKDKKMTVRVGEPGGEVWWA